jgi:3-isopropylmalate/(R)-2-methylmalate dehydratase small subunit
MAVFCYDRDDINTDLLFPGKYTYTCATGPEIVEHLLEDLDPGFRSAVRPGDVILAGRNFGCGSSREQPSLGLKYAGVRAVIARSFARIFYRSALNQGLMLVESPEAVDAWREGDEVTVDPASGTVTVGGSSFGFPPMPPEMLGILEDGGLLEHVRRTHTAGGDGE